MLIQMGLPEVTSTDNSLAVSDAEHNGTNVRHEVQTAMLLKIQVFWDAMLCWWVNSF
jgi:hypothetical protein